MSGVSEDAEGGLGMEMKSDLRERQYPMPGDKGVESVDEEEGNAANQDAAMGDFSGTGRAMIKEVLQTSSEKPSRWDEEDDYSSEASGDSEVIGIVRKEPEARTKIKEKYSSSYDTNDFERRSIVCEDETVPKQPLNDDRDNDVVDSRVRHITFKDEASIKSPKSPTQLDDEDDEDDANDFLADSRVSPITEDDIEMKSPETPVMMNDSDDDSVDSLVDSEVSRIVGKEKRLSDSPDIVEDDKSSNKPISNATVMRIFGKNDALISSSMGKSKTDLQKQDDTKNFLSNGENLSTSFETTTLSPCFPMIRDKEKLLPLIKIKEELDDNVSKPSASSCVKDDETIESDRENNERVSVGADFYYVEGIPQPSGSTKPDAAGERTSQQCDNADSYTLEARPQRSDMVECEAVKNAPKLSGNTELDQEDNMPQPSRNDNIDQDEDNACDSKIAEEERMMKVSGNNTELDGVKHTQSSSKAGSGQAEMNAEPSSEEVTHPMEKVSESSCIAGFDQESNVGINIVSSSIDSIPDVYRSPSNENVLASSTW